MRRVTVLVTAVELNDDLEVIDIRLRAEIGQGGEYFGLHMDRELTFNLPEPVHGQVYPIEDVETEKKKRRGKRKRPEPEDDDE